MSVGSPFDARAAALNVRRQWRQWAGSFASTAYAPHIDIEYNAIRNAAAVIDVSPLFKYCIEGTDAERLVDRVITRNAASVTPGRVIYTPWCDGEGRLIDDGTIHRLDDGSWRWTAAEGQLRWLEMNARGLDVDIRDEKDSVAALALQGPLSRAILEALTQTSLEDLGYFRRRQGSIGGADIDISRTGYTGDLGYELWIAREDAERVWDALLETGADYALRPAGIAALDVVRLEAGLIMADVDYTSSRQALTDAQSYSPVEMGFERLLDLDKEVPFVGRAALRAERDRGGPPRRLVGLELDWDDLARLHARHDLPPTISAEAWRDQIPIYVGSDQVGRATSGTWSLVLKKNIAIGTVEVEHADVDTRLMLEWSVEGERGRIGAEVVAMPFFDPPHKRA